MDEWSDEHCKNWFQQINQNLQFYESKNIKTFILNWQPDYNKYFEIVLIDIEHELIKIPVLEYDAEMTICPKIWNELLTQLSLFGDRIKIKCNEEIIELKCIGDQGEMKIDIPIDNIQEYSINEGEEMEMLFYLHLLSKLTLTTKLTNSVSISFKKEYPLQIKYMFDNNILVFYVLGTNVFYYSANN
jgi:hypothetical protein